VIYSLKELAHFCSKVLVDFLHIQYIDIMTYWRHSKTLNRIYLNTAHPQSTE